MPQLIPLRWFKTEPGVKPKSALSACIKEHTQLEPSVKNLPKTEGCANECLGRGVTGKK